MSAPEDARRARLHWPAMADGVQILMPGLLLRDAVVAAYDRFAAVQAALFDGSE